MIKVGELNNKYNQFKEKLISGRYITNDDINPLLLELKKSDSVKVEWIGESFLKKPISKIVIGNGKKAVLIWTQMHGNESTGTKAVFDLICFLTTNHEFSSLKDRLLDELTVHIIPILNPDGAEAYIRLNAQQIDLNRDVVTQKAPETKLLMNQLQTINPLWCFNLHDQRTIFSVGKENNPATLSFLAPSTNISRTKTVRRKEVMCLIANMNKFMQEILPNQIGRYTDEFYPTATGDNFQKMGYNTVLIEAGHYMDDYQRENTRRYNFIALVLGLESIITSLDKISYKDYLIIPNNKKKYADILYLNTYVDNVKQEVLVVFKEELRGDKVNFIPNLKILENTRHYNANSIVVDEYRFGTEQELLNFIKKRVEPFVL